MLKNHMSTCKKTHVNMQHLFLMPHTFADRVPHSMATFSNRSGPTLTISKWIARFAQVKVTTTYV